MFEKCEKHQIGIALSTYFIGLDLGLGVGPYLLGELRTYLSFQKVYVVAAILPVLCIVLYAMFYHQDTKEKVTI